MKQPQFHFAHETLDAYRLAVEVARWVASVRFPRGSSGLKKQALDASQSVVLNIAEGRARSGDSRQYHYNVAHGSAAETCAALDLIEVLGRADHQAKLRRIGAMLCKMAR